MRPFGNLHLQFDDPALEAGWRASILDARRRRLRWAVGLIGALIALAGVRDLVLGLEGMRPLLTLRFAVAVPVCLAGVAATFTRIGTRIDAIGFATIAALSLFFYIPATALAAAHPPAHQNILNHFSGLAFVMLGLMSAHLMLGLSHRYANALGVFVLAIWGVSSVIARPPGSVVAVQGFLLAATNAMCMFAGFAVERSSRDAYATHRLLEVERGRSEQLLGNILPGPIAARLKQGTKTIADDHPEVSVLFLDLVGFTALSTRLPAAELVQRLNHVFTAFDRLVAERGLEKVKTIGDAYMVAAGIPEARPDHAEAIADLALEMVAVLRSFAGELGEPVVARVGIHSGPVVAGVIGERKFAYDLWGDTVNIASRMESSGEPGRIQLTAVTAAKLARHFDIEPRGTIEIKGKGPVDTAWLLGRALR